jgi:hypothetical protein
VSVAYNRIVRVLMVSLTVFVFEGVYVRGGRVTRVMKGVCVCVRAARGVCVRACCEECVCVLVLVCACGAPSCVWCVLFLFGRLCL